MGGLSGRVASTFKVRPQALLSEFLGRVRAVSSAAALDGRVEPQSEMVVDQVGPALTVVEQDVKASSVRESTVDF